MASFFNGAEERGDMERVEKKFLIFFEFLKILFFNFLFFNFLFFLKIFEFTFLKPTSESMSCIIRNIKRKVKKCNLAFIYS